MRSTIVIGAAAAAVYIIALHAAEAGGPSWVTVVNNGQLMPNSTKLFNSYNQPSLNDRGLVVFRARSKGPEQPVRGIYTLDLLSATPAIGTVAVVSGEVPQPNNIEYPPGSGALATFREFPSFPRIDAASDMIATRGQSQPVWNYLLPDGTETSVGTSGIYATVDGGLATGASLLGAVADAKSGELVFPWWQVPAAPTGTRFDQFPGAPAVWGNEFIAFKGNYTDPITLIGRTGVFYRSMRAMGGESPVVLVANSLMPIPGQDSKVPVLFGSTAPPSAADGKIVFLGLDNEEAPTMGGIYLADVGADGGLQELVAIGDPVPGVPDVDGTPGGSGDAAFNRLGEALSFDGRWLAFWGAWGTETRELLLECPVDGNADVIASCNEQHPDGFIAQVPVHQGIFVIDVGTGCITPVALTGPDYDDFVFWNFSGSPGTGGDKEGGDQEPPRWRSTSFVAVDGTPSGAFRVAFKAHVGVDDAIVLRTGPAALPATVLASTSTPGTVLDPMAPAGSLVTAIGIERDGLRNGRIALVASMLDSVTGESWAGLYARQLPPIPTCTGDLNGDGSVGPIDLAELLSQWGPCDGCSADIDLNGMVNGVDLALLLANWGPCD